MFKGVLEDSVESLHRRRLLTQVGLYGVPLNEAQEGVISVICGMLPQPIDDPIPLQFLPVADRPAVLQLLRQLPTTNEIQRLSEGKDW